MNEDGMAITLTHVETGTRMTLLSNERIDINGKERRLDGLSIALLRRMVADHPDATPRSALAAIMVTENRSAEGVTRAIGDLRNWLEEAKLPDLVETVYKGGYRLNEGWVLEETESNSSEIDIHLQEVLALGREAAARINRLEFREENGAQFVSVPDEEIEANFKRYQRSAWGLIRALSAEFANRAALIVKLKKELYEMCSYVIFWRMGTGLEEESWKEEFRQEVATNLSIIELIVRRIREGET